MSKGDRYPWYNVTVTTSGEPVRTKGGNVIVGFDANGLPELHFQVEDEYYDGVMDHRTLMSLISELAIRRKDSRTDSPRFTAQGEGAYRRCAICCNTEDQHLSPGLRCPSDGGRGGGVQSKGGNGLC